MTLNNSLIYELANKLININFEQKMPVKINFFLQKNINLIIQASAAIEKERLNIAEHFGQLNQAKNAYDIPKENLAQVESELYDLFAIEQDLNIHIFKLDEFENIELTYEQFEAISFMIEE